MRRERFVMDENSTFDYLYENRNNAEIGQMINVALAAIERNNSAKLHNVFRAIDFNSQVDFGEVREKNAILKNLREDFRELDLRPSQLDTTDIIGDGQVSGFGWHPFRKVSRHLVNTHYVQDADLQLMKCHRELLELLEK